MSHTYHFVCVDCREVIDVGKLVTITETAVTCDVHFGGWRDQVRKNWLGGGELHTLLERWHILHRGHEIRMVTERYLDDIDPEGALTYIDTASEIMERPVTPEPDDENDARRVPSGVAERLTGRSERVDGRKADTV